MVGLTPLWGVFGVIVVVGLYVDLFLKNDRDRAHAISVHEAGRWVVIWVSLALAFAGLIGFFHGRQKTLEFLTAYIVEESLSADNMFVFVMIFRYFAIPAKSQPSVLKFGILGAIAMRLLIIFVGVALVQRFHWIFYGFGALLIITAIKMLAGNEENIRPDQNVVVKFFRRFFPFSDKLEGESFFQRQNGRWVATLLFMTLIVIEVSDLIFAVDSIPAVLAISPDPFIVATSNIFAILGLRALFFILSGMMDLFRFLKYGIAVILIFIGVKMLIIDFYKIPVAVSLLVVVAALLAAVAASKLVKTKQQSDDES